MGQIQGGYRAITAGELIGLIVARNSGKVSSSALRVYLGCHLLVASREAAKAKAPRYTLTELRQRVGGKDFSQSRLEKALEELKEANILTYQETAIHFHSSVTPEIEEIAKAFGTSTARPVPIPRYVLRLLAKHTKPAEMVAALGHLIRCLFIKRSRINSKGFVKSSFLASVLGISERVVHSARKWLESLNILEPVEVAQWILNRFGACFRVRLSHGTPDKKTKFAPPNKTLKEVHTNQNNNKPTEAVNAGFCMDSIKNPTLADIQTEDLKRMGRLEQLYKQALERGWLSDCEFSIRNFVSAAARATRVAGNPAKVFVGIVKKRLWHHITQAQEDHAMSVLKRYREKHPGAFKQVKPVEAATPAKTASAIKTLIESVVTGKAVGFETGAGEQGRGASRDSGFPKATPPVTHTEGQGDPYLAQSRLAGTCAARGGLWGRTPNVAYAGSPGRHSSRQVGNRAVGEGLAVPA